MIDFLFMAVRKVFKSLCRSCVHMRPRSSKVAPNKKWVTNIKMQSWFFWLFCYSLHGHSSIFLEFLEQFFLVTLQLCYTIRLAACRIFYLQHFNSLYTHKGLVFLCAPPRHRVMWLNCHALGKSLSPAGIELGTFGLQFRHVIATAPTRLFRDHISWIASTCTNGAALSVQWHNILINR